LDFGVFTTIFAFGAITDQQTNNARFRLFFKVLGVKSGGCGRDLCAASNFRRAEDAHRANIE